MYSMNIYKPRYVYLEQASTEYHSDIVATYQCVECVLTVYNAEDVQWKVFTVESDHTTS